MTISTELQNAVNRFEDNEARIDVFVNGGVDSVWTTTEGEQLPSVRNLIKNVIKHNDIRNYGASPSLSDNRVAIQTAIDNTEGVLWVPSGVFEVTLDPSSAGLAGVFGNSSVSLHPKSNLKITGPGTIKLKAGQNGASGAIIGNWRGTPVTNFVLEGITLEGNKANTFGQVSGCVLVDALECGYERVKAKNISYNGLQMRRSSGVDGSVFGVQDCWITNCITKNIGYIGIQANRPNGIKISGNIVQNTFDNGIDVEADDIAGGFNNAGFGKSIQIFDNSLADISNVGIFIESVGDVMINNNRIRDALTGAYFNRINSGALGNSFSNNKLSRTKSPGGDGVLVINNSGDMRITENDFDSFDNSIRLSTSATFVSIGTNYHRNVKKYVIAIDKVTNSVVKSFVERQVLKDVPGILYATPQAFPALSPPYNSPSNLPTRAFSFLIDNARTLDGGVNFGPGFKLGEASLVFSSTWNAYSLYNSGSDGKTRVILSSTISGAAYILIGTSSFKISSAGTGNTYVSKWNGTAFVDGNFTAELNSALVAQVYPTWWVTE